MRGDPYEQRAVPCRAHRVEDLQRIAQPMLQRTAVLVGAPIGHRREEGGEQVAVRGVQLEDVEADVGGATGRRHEVVPDPGEVLPARLPRHPTAGPVREGRGTDRLPAVGVEGIVHALPHPLRGRLPAGMSQLQPDPRGRRGVHEVDDPLPRLRLLVGVQSGVPEGDPALRGGRDHLGHDETGTADRLGAEMHEMEVADDPIDGRVLVHRGHDDAVLQFELSQPEGLEERRDLLRPVAIGEAGLHPGRELGVAQRERAEGDPPGARQQVEGELQGLLVDVLLDVLEPLQRGLRRALEGEHDRTPFGLVGRERRGDVRLLVQVRREGERVLQRELGPGADREVRRVRGVADEHDVVMRPALIADGGEGDPLRVVGQQSRAVELLREDVGEPRDGSFVAHAWPEDLALGRVEAGTAPDLLVHLDQEGALDVEGEGLYRAVDAQPDVPGGPPVQRRSEGLGVVRADPGVDAVGGDDELVVLGELVDLRRLDAESHVDVERSRPFLEQHEQFLAAGGREALAADREDGVVEVDVDVAPSREAPRDRRVEHRVRVLDAPERLVAEHHAQTERVVGGVALPDRDLVARVQPLRQDREVQPGRAAADDGDAPTHAAARSAGTAPPLRPRRARAAGSA